MNTPRVAIYARVSTEKQTHDSQLKELQDFCRRREWENTTVYTDKASGAKFTRQGLDKLMQEVRKGRVDVIVCYKLDRLGRSLAHLAQIIGEMTGYNVALVCPSQGIDTSDNNPAGRLQLGVLMAVAEFERSIIQERVKAGLRSAMAQGKKLGRPATLFQHEKAVRSLLVAGKGVREISRQLGLAPSSTAKLIKMIRKQLSNPI